MIKLYINRKSGVDATAIYDFEAGTFTVLKCSKVSGEISHSEKFRGAKSIEKSRQGTVDGCVVTQDVIFKSASTAANYVCGSSVNGLTAWKDENGKTLKAILSELEG